MRILCDQQAEWPVMSAPNQMFESGLTPFISSENPCCLQWYKSLQQNTRGGAAVLDVMKVLKLQESWEEMRFVVSKASISLKNLMDDVQLLSQQQQQNKHHPLSTSQHAFQYLGGGIHWMEGAWLIPSTFYPFVSLLWSYSQAFLFLHLNCSATLFICF